MYIYCRDPAAVCRNVDGALRFGRPALVLNTQKCRADTFQAAIRNATGLIVDFDGTLIDESQWPYLLRMLPPEVQERNNADFHACVTSQQEDPFKREFMQLITSLRDLRNAGVSREDMQQVALQLRLRSGALDLLRSFPLGKRAIVSWGIHDIIAAVMEQHQEVDVGIRSAKLSWGQDGLLSSVPCDDDTVVTQSNKGMVRNRLRWEWGVEENKLLIVADGPTDKELLSDRSISVLIVSPKDNKTRMQVRRRMLPELFTKCHAILVAPDLEPLAALRS